MRDRWLAAVLASLMWGLGCAPPTHLLLRSRCGDAAADCSPPKPDESPTTCKDTSDCADGEDCFKSVCIACAKLLESCSTCPAGSEPYKVLAGVCVSCECRPLCKLHSDCGLGMVCAAGSCVDCKATSCPAQCSWGFSPQAVRRNGCTVCECAPKNLCNSDAECGSGLICYPGTHCDDNCLEAKCCHGNQCAAPGCKAPGETISCSVVGCAAGECRGDTSCAATGCACDPAKASTNPTGWYCSQDCDARCETFR